MILEKKLFAYIEALGPTSKTVELQYNNSGADPLDDLKGLDIILSEYENAAE